MLNSKDLTILQRGGKTPGARPVEDSMNVAWNLPSNFQLDWSFGFRNVGKSNIVWEIPKMFDISIHRLLAFRVGGHHS